MNTSLDIKSLLLLRRKRLLITLNAAHAGNNATSPWIRFGNCNIVVYWQVPIAISWAWHNLRSVECMWVRWLYENCMSSGNISAYNLRIDHRCIRTDRLFQICHLHLTILLESLNFMNSTIIEVVDSCASLVIGLVEQLDSPNNLPQIIQLVAFLFLRLIDKWLNVMGWDSGSTMLKRWTQPKIQWDIKVRTRFLVQFLSPFRSDGSTSRAISSREVRIERYRRTLNAELERESGKWLIMLEKNQPFPSSLVETISVINLFDLNWWLWALRSACCFESIRVSDKATCILIVSSCGWYMPQIISIAVCMTFWTESGWRDTYLPGFSSSMTIVLANSRANGSEISSRPRPLHPSWISWAILSVMSSGIEKAWKRFAAVYWGMKTAKAIVTNKSKSEE